MDQKLSKLFSYPTKNCIQFHNMQYLKLSYIATNNNLIVVISYCMHGLGLIFLFIVFYTGFIRPAFVEKMLLADDPAGFDFLIFHQKEICIWMTYKFLFQMMFRT